MSAIHDDIVAVLDKLDTAATDLATGRVRALLEDARVWATQVPGHDASTAAEPPQPPAQPEAQPPAGQ